MIDFSRAQLTHFILHYVGNKGLGEEMTLTEKPVEFKDDFVKETLLRYLLSPFKTDIYHEFKGKIDVSLQSVANACEDMFHSRYQFVKHSQEVAQHLYNQSMHPKIKGGEFYVAYFKDAVVDGELCDAVGFFKTENKETFLKVYQNVDEFDVDCDNGININKLDKGCIVFNTDQQRGYKLSLVDTNNKVAECALYWEEDFLNAHIKTNSYYHTNNFINAAVGFSEEILTETNNVTQLQQMEVLNKSVSFVAGHERVNQEEFNREVLQTPELIEAFKDYKDDYAKRLDLTMVDDFEVSETAVKKNKKYMRAVIKLDKNFHLYIHGRHDLMENGYDEEKGMKYYKVFYVNEEK